MVLAGPRRWRPAPLPAGILIVGTPMIVAERGGLVRRGGGSGGGGRGSWLQQQRPAAEAVGVAATLGAAAAWPGFAWAPFLDHLGDLLEHGLRVPWLGKVRIRADLRAEGGVVGSAVADEDRDRNVRELRVGLQREAEVVAVLAGHRRIGEHDGGTVPLRFLERFIEVARADVGELGATEGDVRDLLHRGAVINAQNDLALRRSPADASRQATPLVDAPSWYHGSRGGSNQVAVISTDALLMPVHQLGAEM